MAEMSELKAKHVVDVYDEYSDNPTNEAQVYLKCEADAYISELEEKHKNEVGQLLLSLEQTKKAAQTLRKKMNHHKRKRCLAMARMCEERSARYDALQEGHDLDWRREIEFYYKWYMRWLTLAKKFKEAK